MMAVRRVGMQLVVSVGGIWGFDSFLHVGGWRWGVRLGRQLVRLEGRCGYYYKVIQITKIWCGNVHLKCQWGQLRVSDEHFYQIYSMTEWLGCSYNSQIHTSILQREAWIRIVSFIAMHFICVIHTLFPWLLILGKIKQRSRLYQWYNIYAYKRRMAQYKILKKFSTVIHLLPPHTFPR